MSRAAGGLHNAGMYFAAQSTLVIEPQLGMPPTPD
jgi:hypothetical protein